MPIKLTHKLDFAMAVNCMPVLGGRREGRPTPLLSHAEKSRIAGKKGLAAAPISSKNLL